MNGEWGWLHNEDLHSLYLSPSIIRVINTRRLKWAGIMTKMEEGRSAFKYLTCILPGKRILGRPRSRWEGNIRMNLKKNRY